MKNKNKMKALMGKDNPNARAIVVTEIETGIEVRFDTITQAALEYKVNRVNISCVLRGKSQTFLKKQFTARYED